jgi:GT2 family glycosyltransferase
VSVDISAAIVNWNTRERLRDCLSSLYEHMSGVSLEVMVIDNASADGSQDMVRKEFPGVRLLANTENIGFGRACNQAARECRGTYLLLLNPDTRILEVDWKGLFSRLREARDVGAIVPVAYDDSGDLRYKHRRTIPRIKDVLNYYVFHNLLKFRDSMPMSTADIQVQGYPSGSCLLMKHSVFTKLNGFDERYFLYFEDADLGVRMGHAGLRTISHPEFRITHIGGDSTRKDIRLRDMCSHKSALYS